MPYVRATVALPAVLLLLLAGRVARADDATTANAREHYQKGTSYYDLGRYQDAIREFEAAYELKNDPALLYNLAQSHRLAGNAEQALHFYRTYLRRVPKATNRTEIEGRIAALEQQVAQKSTTTPPPGGGGTATTTTPPPGGGGTTTTTTPPPGGGGTTSTTTTTPPPPGGGGTTTTTPPPYPPLTTPPGDPAMGSQTTTIGTTYPPPVAEDPGRKLKLVGAGTMAAGGLLFFIGVIEGFRAVAAANEINDAAKAGRIFDPEVERRGKRAQAWEVGLIITGTLVAAGGAGLYFYGRRKSEQATSMSIAPMASTQGIGALLRVTF